MGNSASTGFITSTPKKLSWGRQKEDTVKLEDFLTQCEESVWRARTKPSVKKLHLTRSIGYVDLSVQEGDRCHPNRGEILNPAFIRDEAV